MTHYRTDMPQTAAEIFDGELVIANYGSGLYYSIASGGALVWQGLRYGFSGEEVTSWLSAAYADAHDLGDRVASFIARLSDEGLIAAVGDVPARDGQLPHLPAMLGELELERFEDLQELLLLDPVHDVAEAGWPHRAESSE